MSAPAPALASRLISRLDQAIIRAESPLQQECLKAERAAALARHGRIADARFALAGVRTQAKRHRSPALTAWVHMLDGLVDHFETVSPRARDKFQQAYEVAEKAGDAWMQSLASAWLATSAFNASDLQATGQHISQALRLAVPDHHAALARVGVVLADGYRFVGDDAQSRRWYDSARSHMLAEGDTAMLSVLLYNIAAMRAGRISLDDAFGRGDTELASQALLEIESSANFDWGTGAASLAAMIPVTRAQLLVVLQRYPEAASLFDGYLDKASKEGMAHREPRFLVDRAWCQFHRGYLTDAARDLRHAEAGLPTLVDDDDRAATLARMAAVMAGMGRNEESQALHQRAEAALQLHLAVQQRWQSVLDQAVSTAGKAPAQA